MCIILRLICEILSGIAVEIRFLWNSKHGIYGAASFIAILTSWYLRMDMRTFTSVILKMNIICISQWLFETNFEILHCSGAFAWRYKHFNPNVLSCKHVLIIFYRENMTSFLNYVTATLRTLYAWRGSFNSKVRFLAFLLYFVYEWSSYWELTPSLPLTGFYCCINTIHMHNTLS